MRVMEAAADAPNLASAMNIGAFNLGNAIGAALGGGVIDAGLGYPAVPLAGAAMAATGLLIAGAAARATGGAGHGLRLRAPLSPPLRSASSVAKTRPGPAVALQPAGGAPFREGVRVDGGPDHSAMPVPRTVSSTCSARRAIARRSPEAVWHPP